MEISDIYYKTQLQNRLTDIASSYSIGNYHCRVKQLNLVIIYGIDLIV